ncbi:MAG: uroporphyrinogen decarboxylase [Chloroflexi bacterium]|nr:uroporphyrinogen decarboxylase [Chloroflexota bacterium]
MASLTKKERVIAALSGQPVDRVPTSFWGHDYLREWSASGLAEAMLEAHSRYDWDFMKVNPRASYYVEDWGCKFKPSGHPHRSPVCVKYAVREPGDWELLQVLDPYKGALGEQIQALRLIGSGLKGDAPYVQTVFSPLSVAGRLAEGGEERVKGYMKEAPQALHQGLLVIAETLAQYAKACLEVGASGIFFATTAWATYDLLNEEEYREFGLNYDLKVLTEVAQATFNILHICRDNNMFDLLADYPVAAINWAATLSGNSSLQEGLKRTDKAVMGGISEKTILKDGPLEAIAAEVYAALEQTQGRRFLLAPGCSIPTDVPSDNLDLVRRALNQWPKPWQC